MLIAMQDLNTPSAGLSVCSHAKGYLNLNFEHTFTELFDLKTEINNTIDDTKHEDDFDAEAYQDDDTLEPELFGEIRSVE